LYDIEDAEMTTNSYIYPITGITWKKLILTLKKSLAGILWVYGTIRDPCMKSPCTSFFLKHFVI